MASSVVSSAIQQVGSLLVEEAKFLYDVKGKIESLQVEMEWMECFLEDADSRQHKEKLVRKWVAQIIEFAYEAEDLLERYLHQVPRREDTGIWSTVKWFSNLLCACHVYKVHCLGSNIDELTTKIAELNSRLTRYGVKLSSPAQNMAYNAMMREERRTYSHIEEEVVGLEKDVKEVVQKLTKTEIKVVGIIGMGGLGKSTLARKVFQDKAIKEHFTNCAWVYTSKEFNRRNIYEDILSGLVLKNDTEGILNGKKINELTNKELPEIIHELLQQKGCFVIIDDIWFEKDWVELKPALGSISKESSLSKILLTTRTEGLLQHVDSNGYSHPLKPLNDDNSWKLLLRKAFPQRKRAGRKEATSSADASKNDVKTAVDAEEKKKEELGKEMLKHCGGLPLAIVALGGILSTKRTFREWEEVKNNISAYLMTDMVGGSKSGGILPVLELSYNALPYYLKPCFLYLACFPEDYEISTNRLYHLWEVEGILEVPNRDEIGVEGAPSCFEMGERCLLELVQRSMVQAGNRSISGKIKTCRVHDLMRDLSIKKCKEASFLNIVQEGQGSITQRKQLRRCALHGSIEVACSPQHWEKATCIRSLLAFPSGTYRKVDFDREDWLDMVKCFPMLRVLDLQGNGNTSQVLDVGNFIHLRYLNVSGMKVNEVASCIGNLKYLVTLDLRGLYEVKLPNMFHQMKRLRHLYLPPFISVIGSEEKLSFGGLQVETLKNFDPKRCEMKDLLQMTRLRTFSIIELIDSEDELKVFAETPLGKSEHMVSFVRLRVAMEVINKSPTILSSVRCFIKLELLGIEGEELINSMAEGTQVLPRNLTHLLIQCLKLSRQFILQLEKLPHLQGLTMSVKDMGDKITFSAGSFPHLQGLIIHADGLEEWEVGDGALPNLQRLELSCCSKLKKLPEGLPDSVDIECYDPCIKGIEKYNTCPHFQKS